MQTERLRQLVADCSAQFRKGEEVVDASTDSLRVTHVFDMPPVSDAENLRKVDVHFVVIGVDTARAEESREEIKNIILANSDELQIKEGPSYISTGAVLGDQGFALQLYGVGAVLGFWKIITPETLGLSDGLADAAAGNGYIMVDGFDPDGITPEVGDETLYLFPAMA